LFYGLTLGAIVLVALAGAFADADVDHPSVHDSSTLRFSYPGNWWIDREYEDYDPDANLFIEPMHDAFISIKLYESDASPEEELAVSLEAYDPDMKMYEDGASLESVGYTVGVNLNSPTARRPRCEEYTRLARIRTVVIRTWRWFRLAAGWCGVSGVARRSGIWSK
jgi:hypothetical protein